MANLQTLAKFLQRATNAKVGKTDKETIKNALDLIKRKKELDTSLIKQIETAMLKEETDVSLEKPTVTNPVFANGQTQAPIVPPPDVGETTEPHKLWDYVIKKLKDGEPTVIPWVNLNLQSVGHDDNLERFMRFKKIRDLWEVASIDDFADNDYDDENDIEYSDIEVFLKDLETTDYIELYDPDEIEWIDVSETDPLDDESESGELVQAEQAVKDAHTAQELAEALTRAQRLKLKMAMKRNKAKIAMKRKLALKRHSTPDVLKKRARKLAIKMLKKKYGKKPVNQLSMAERERIEKLLKTKQGLINRLTIKMIPVVRKIEAKRFQAKKEQ